MVTERFRVVALPRSRAAGADFHVSLFVGPALVPDGPEGILKDFKHFRRWAKLLGEDATFELRDQAGPIPVTPVLAALEPATWEAVFPLDTPVRGKPAPALLGRRWRSFRAATLHDAAKLFHVVSMVADPTRPPLPSRHPLLPALGRLLRDLKIGSVAARRGAYDESEVTETLDAIIRETGQEPLTGLALAKFEIALGQGHDPMLRFAAELHRARRFYERPEAQAAYRERPDPNATSPRPPRPEPDFHERCSLVGDHAALLRKLGLVVDLVVEDPTRLLSSKWLSGRIVPSGDGAACQVFRTRCEVAGPHLVTVSATGDWHQGRAILGDTERYAVLDLDPDGTALKLDRFLWTLPRLLAVERNGDPAHAAPAALRSRGLTVVRHQRATGTVRSLVRQDELDAGLGAGAPPDLFTEDVTQGLRVDVWDDTAKAWFSLHQRMVDADVHGVGKVVDDAPEEGFVQGTTLTETPGVADSPVHVHEAVFGWEGWSLSAPKPGKRVRHEGGDEVVEEPTADPDPVTPVVITAKVAPGTLPRLRYGRSYAFRAWAVDLAGNSRPRALGPPASAPPAPVVSAVAAALAGAAVAPATPSAVAGLTSVLRADAADAARTPPAPAEETAARGPTALEVLGDARVNAAVLGRLRARRPEGARLAAAEAAGASRASIVRRAFQEAVLSPREALVRDTARVDAAALAAALAPGDVSEVAPALVKTVSPLHPFLRWEPVAPPVVVARQPYTAGESLRQVVIRSGVTQDPETLDIAVTPPADYAAAHGELGYRATSDRHLAPPKTSQSEAETHGAFDAAIGSIDPAAHKKLLAVALREAGTLFDVAVRRLDDPSQLEPQPGVRLESGRDVPPSVRKTLPLPLGEMPAPGQYVVHDTDQLVLPYLPDVLARGVSLVFPEAGRDRALGFPFGTEGFTARYEGAWPTPKPFRLVLEGADTLGGALEGTALRIALPPGDMQRFRLASCLDRADLALMGLWQILPEAVRAFEEVAEAAADGWLWALTPADDVTLVHAVPRPLEAPRPTTLVPMRLAEGATAVALVGAVDVHGPSTDSLTAEARWVDPVDDLSLPAPEERSQRGVAFTTPVGEGEDLAVLGFVTEDMDLPLPGLGPVRVHAAHHKLDSTRHHTITYRFRAATRFREYFERAELAPTPRPAGAGPEVPTDDGQSVVGPEITLSVPSSARPAAPLVHSVLPLFRWEEATEPEQPVDLRRGRRAGVRIYLERPWYSSGEGELLGVLVAPALQDAGLDGLVSQWGADPVWLSAPVQHRAMMLELDNLLHMTGLDDRPGDARPVVAPATLPLPVGKGSTPVTVLGYRPQFNAERGLWYVDVAIDPGDAFWPFVRLAVARYQPDSIPGCHLSKPVLCDYVQLTPERTASVSRTDVRHARVVVSGPVGFRATPKGASLAGLRVPEDVDMAAWAAANRTVVARLQRRDPALDTDLGWETVAVANLAVRGRGRSAWEAAWVGTLAAPEDIPLRRPGESADWRVTVEEWERLLGDPDDLGAAGLFAPPRRWERRLVYADAIAL